MFDSNTQAADKSDAAKPATEKPTTKPAEGTVTKPQPTPTVATQMSAAGTSETDVEGESLTVEPLVSAKILRYADRLVRRYDTNHDSQLQQSEWKAMRGDPRLADFDSDGIITLEEIARRVARYGYRRKIRLISKPLEVSTPSPTLLQPITTPVTDEKASETAPADKPAGGESSPNVTEQVPPKHDYRPGQRFYVAPRHRVQGLPGWFTNRDANGDQQISMAEFASKATQSDMKEFARYDANGDGVITAKECAGKASSDTSTLPKSSDEGEKKSP
ncbi:MAG: hypothetical protein JXM70_24160 [Pirellulales bacterium]|nr:hypothetical protein [Pirellulales bacterium]